MVRATYQTRLSAIVLGIRPSAAHLYGARGRPPADNLTHLGLEAWRLGLGDLLADIMAASDTSAGERWIENWIVTELDRDANRWSDASTLLELLAISLGPATAEPSHGPRGRLFWVQWYRNILHLQQQLETHATAPSSDTAELVEHCRQLVEDHAGPRAVFDGLHEIEQMMGPVAPASPFRPLASAVERLQLSVILSSAYDTTPPCSATMARLVELRPPTIPCEAHANRIHRMRSDRYRAASPDR